MSLKGKKILITYGPTQTPIDGVRVISNISSGRMGRLLVESFKKEKACLTVLEGPVQHPLSSAGVKIFKFAYFRELHALVKKELKKKYDVFIHAAAVSDYRIKRPLRTKLPSGLKNRRLSLVPTPKIIRMIKARSPGIFLVGFKLESSGSQNRLKQKTLDLIRDNRCGLAVGNSLQPDGRYRALIMDPEGNIVARAASRAEAARRLVKLLDKKL